MTRGSDTIESSVDRVLQSGTFRNSPTSRRLLKYLADHSVAGDADQLKEYTIGVDAFGKPPDYDPRQDSTVRIQIGRLRQKLCDYYREEGKEDPFVVDLPKGRFSLTCEVRPAAAAVVEEVAEPAPVMQPNRWRLAAVGFAALCLVLIGLGVYSYLKLRSDLSSRQLSSAFWSPELAAL